jgi:hypothetical protein
MANKIKATANTATIPKITKPNKTFANTNLRQIPINYRYNTTPFQSQSTSNLSANFNKGKVAISRVQQKAINLTLQRVSNIGSNRPET